MRIDIEKNKQTYIELLFQLSQVRADCAIVELVKYLEESDFFNAPCTTQYHNCIEGGLCDHALNVYYQAQKIVDVNQYDICPGSLLIVSLCKDLGKINYYESYLKNEKVYSPQGSKIDNYGKYDWQSVKYYKVKDVKDRDTIGSLAFNAYNIISQYIPLTKEEIATILNYDLGMSNNYTNCETLNIASKYSLVPIIHCADILASYVEEYE